MIFLSEIGLQFAASKSMKEVRFLSIIGLSLIIFSSWSMTEESPLQNSSFERGQWLAKKASCTACHTGKDGLEFGGGYEIQSPVGLFRTPNISSSKEYGIGTWSFEDFDQAVRKGISPQGQHYFPAFPYQHFAKLSTEDVKALYDYILSRPAIEKKNSPHRFDKALLDNSFGLKMWRNVSFREFSNPVKNFLLGTKDFDQSYPQYKEVRRLNLTKEEEGLFQRGAYLTEAVFHCSMCHTPRRYDPLLKKVATAPLVNFWMGGSRGAPNITPSEKYGLGKWTKDDYVNFFKTGIRPDGRKMTSSGMDIVIEETKDLSKKDLDSLIFYLRKLPPVDRYDKEDFK